MIIRLLSLGRGGAARSSKARKPRRRRKRLADFLCSIHLEHLWQDPAAGAPFGVGLFNLGRILDILVTALEAKGVARRLAEPDLIALSGDTASFLAGGKYPVPSVQSSSGTAPVITTQYYPYGKRLSGYG
jgi:Flp pilus assembly secretin CpaC